NDIFLESKENPVLIKHNVKNKNGFYIAGDCIKGPSTVVKAVADDKKFTKYFCIIIGITHDFVKTTVDRSAEDLRYKKGFLSAQSDLPQDNGRCLGCDVVCEICTDVCPNRANVLLEGNIILHVDGMCNECGNCGVFCPHSGNPYKDKLTVFWTEEDFVDSTNKGFLKTSENNYKVRNEDNKIVEYVFGSTNPDVSEEFVKVINLINKNYEYYLG
ncbi:MAG: putative selenate reductase subunit YgfK, partial [Lachnospirales bacterium]